MREAVITYGISREGNLFSGGLIRPTQSTPQAQQKHRTFASDISCKTPYSSSFLQTLVRLTRTHACDPTHLWAELLDDQVLRGKHLEENVEALLPQRRIEWPP